MKKIWVESRMISCRWERQDSCLIKHCQNCKYQELFLCQFNE